MAQLILHIGGHRTGSTSIQSTLLASRRRLRREGVLYPDTGRIGVAHTGLANAVRGHGAPGFPQTPSLEAALEALRREVERSRCGTVVISSEEFILTSQFRAAEVGRLLGIFSAVRVICFLRHQAPLLESSSKLHTLWDVTASTEGLPEYVETHLHGDRLEWLDVEPFYRASRPDAAIEFVGFAAACHSGSLVRSFFEQAGITAASAGDLRTNESLGRAATLSLLLRNRGEVHDALGRRAFIRFARRLFPEDRQSLYGPALLERVAARFEASNRLLATRCGFDLNDELEAFRSRHTLAGAEFTTAERRRLDEALRRRNRFPLLGLARDFLPRARAAAPSARPREG